jgi:class 3 adenylate cyclase
VSRAPQDSPSLKQILRAQAWRNERLLNVFRAAAWTIVGLITGGAELYASGTISPGAVLALAWGLAAAISGLTWLRRTYRDGIAGLLAMMDITVLALCMQAGHRYLLANDPALVPHQLYGSGIVLVVLLATNVLRFSWVLSLWTVGYGAAAYWTVLWINGAVDVLTYVELALIALLGLLLAYYARRIGVIVRQVAERDSLVRFLPAPLVERVIRDPAAVNLQGEAQEITALFADIRGFASLAERLSPEAVVRMLNEFFSEMAAEIAGHGGIVVQYVGDNIYAVFPEKGGADHARRALRCALGMLERLAEINARRRLAREPALEIGIGVHTGPVIVGSIGSPELLQYSYVGDTVNTASRIERLTRDADRDLLVSESTFSLAGGEAAFRGEAMPAVRLRGKRQALALWAVSAVR